ncbi:MULTISPECIES: MalY/PatB family protein [Symbiopectobacterium]|uniref:MalY/PatB family protein n=1 Tax=Symbiopectobacterium TaxID=801 RepID=UPI001A296115|nr:MULTISPECIES: aminotransferase class I/II-fold pyridoxal phosphate-dependent enzyme [Symbiopectobacterium]MBG6246813.1 aminotransferase class I/II-fold pyridoxal phosphate-dependent enzyme [Candidatus Symbiopectobacterium sp. PLON1]MBT9430149.1 aminotransferase class I/II-fold pyridoxal phosphate-dependent enzyme [Candidatus Symbiopectobacterium endolongispinus]
MNTHYDAGIAQQFAEQYTLPLETLRRRQSMKWQYHALEILPAWVAEMDFAPSPAVADVLRHWYLAQDTGYPYRQRDRAEHLLARAFSRYTAREFNWETDPANVLALNELVRAVYLLILAFSEPGDGIVLKAPSYPPFYDAINDTGRRLQASPLLDNGQGYEIDFDHLTNQIDANTRILLLCNPHNPTGRALRRDELEKLAALAEAHDLIVIANEIHADLVYPGQEHIPFATVALGLAARTITLNSASKSFNIAGLRCALMYFGDGALKQRFTQRLPARILGYPSGIGIDATVAAWDRGHSWLEGARHYLLERREQVITTVRPALPEVRVHTPEATYFAWLDFSELHLPTAAGAYYLEHAKVALTAGETFNPGAEAFARLNFATSKALLQQILDAVLAASRRA